MELTTLYVTNNTPSIIKIQGRVIFARSKQQAIKVVNVSRFINEVKAAYPQGQLIVSTTIESKVQNNTNSPVVAPKPEEPQPPESVAPDKAPSPETPPAAAEEAKTSNAGNELVEIGLSASVERSLVKAGITTIAQLTAMTSEDVISVKGIADAGLQEIVMQLEAQGMALKEVSK